MIAALLLSLAAQAEAPSSWTCEPAFFADGVCDCGCTAVDDDCSEDIACARDNCPDGTRVDDDHDNVCVDDEDDAEEEEEADGCGGAGGAASLVVGPLVRFRRRRR